MADKYYRSDGNAVEKVDMEMHDELVRKQMIEFILDNMCFDCLDCEFAVDCVNEDCGQTIFKKFKEKVE